MDVEFGELRSLLHGEGSQQNWVAVCRLLSQWDRDTLDSAMAYAANILESWDDRSRLLFDEIGPDHPCRGLVRCAVLAAKGNPKHWTHLNLTCLHVDQSGQSKLEDALTHPATDALQALDVHGCLNAQHMAALSVAPCRQTLRWLDIGANALPIDALSLVFERDWPNLHTLNMAHLSLAPEIFNMLCDRQRFPHLQSLCLVNTPVDDDVLRQLSEFLGQPPQTQWRVDPNIQELCGGYVIDWQALREAYHEDGHDEDEDEYEDDLGFQNYVGNMFAAGAIHLNTRGQPIYQYWFDDESNHGFDRTYQMGVVVAVDTNKRCFSVKLMRDQQDSACDWGDDPISSVDLASIHLGTEVVYYETINRGLVLYANRQLLKRTARTEALNQSSFDDARAGYDAMVALGVDYWDDF